MPSLVPNIPTPYLKLLQYDWKLVRWGVGIIRWLTFTSGLLRIQGRICLLSSSLSRDSVLWDGERKREKNTLKQIILWSKNENVLLKRAPRRVRTVWALVFEYHTKALWAGTDPTPKGISLHSSPSLDLFSLLSNPHLCPLFLGSRPDHHDAKSFRIFLRPSIS